jgi:hypothetical protein
MRWIKFEAYHGKGHQSHTVEYHPEWYEMSDDDLDGELEGWAQQFPSGIVKATAEFLNRLPDEQIQKQLELFRRKRDNAQRIINAILEQLEEKE